MWHKLGSPPENFRYYRFSDTSNEKNQEMQKIDFDENRTSLFQGENLSSVPEESLIQTYGEAVSQGTTKPLSSLKSTSKINSRKQEEKSCYDLRLNNKGNLPPKQSLSMLQHSSRQKSSLVLSQIPHSSIIREESSKISNTSKKYNNSQTISNKKEDSFLMSINNQQEDESLSQIFVNEINKTELSKSKNEEPFNRFLYEAMQTLKQIRDISKEHLAHSKKLVKMIEDKSQISFLYDKEEKSDIKPKAKKEPSRKSFKRTHEKDKSTIKKMGKSIILEDRMTKIEQKIRAIYKKLQEDSYNRKTSHLSKTKKKSMSTLR